MTPSPSSRPQQKNGVGGPDGQPPSPSAHRRSATRSRIFRELIEIAAHQGASIPLGISTADALQQCLDRAVALWRFAADQVDHLQLTELPQVPVEDPTTGEVTFQDSYLANLPTASDPLFEVISNPQGPDVIQPHRYVLMEREARLEIEKLAAMMTQLGIAERVVRVQEAQAVLVVAAVREAAIEAGLSHDQVRALGAALRSRLDTAQTKSARPGAHRDGSAPAAQSATRTLATLENHVPGDS